MEIKQGSRDQASVKAPSCVWIFTLVLMIAALPALTACGGTRVYSADKTVVYRDTIYNVSDVHMYRAFSEAVVSDDQTLDLKGVDKRRFNSLLEQHTTMFVRQGFLLDDNELLYQAQSVDSWSDFSRMNKRFNSATKTVTKFIGDGKKTQLRLK